MESPTSNDSTSEVTVAQFSTGAFEPYTLILVVHLNRIRPSVPFGPDPCPLLTCGRRMRAH